MIRHRIIAGILGLVFLYFGALKILDPAAFAIDIQNYRILPWIPGALLAIYLPWLEVLCGAALISRIGYRGALVITAGLLSIFIVAFASARLRGLDIDCGCFGHGIRVMHWPILIADPILLAVALWLLRADLRPLSPVIRTAK